MDEVQSFYDMLEDVPWETEFDFEEPVIVDAPLRPRECVLAGSIEEPAVKAVMTMSADERAALNSPKLFVAMPVEPQYIETVIPEGLQDMPPKDFLKEHRKIRKCRPFADRVSKMFYGRDEFTCVASRFKRVRFRYGNRNVVLHSDVSMTHLGDGLEYHRAVVDKFLEQIRSLGLKEGDVLITDCVDADEFGMQDLKITKLYQELILEGITIVASLSVYNKLLRMDYVLDYCKAMDHNEEVVVVLGLGGREFDLKTMFKKFYNVNNERTACVLRGEYMISSEFYLGWVEDVVFDKVEYVARTKVKMRMTDLLRNTGAPKIKKEYLELTMDPDLPMIVAVTDVEEELLVEGALCDLEPWENWELFLALVWKYNNLEYDEEVGWYVV